MKKLTLILITTVLWTTLVCGQEIARCDTRVLLLVSNKLGNASQSEIRDFLLTFGQECKNNVEFSEWSNELLFDLLDKQTELTLRTIETEEKTIEKKEIINVLRAPINDKINVKELRERIERIVIKRSLKKEIIEALKTAEGLSQ